MSSSQIASQNCVVPFLKTKQRRYCYSAPPPVAVLLMDKLKASAKISFRPSSGSVLHVYFEVPIACVECLYLMF